MRHLKKIFLFRYSRYLFLGLHEEHSSYLRSLQPSKENIKHLKVVTNEKIGGPGVTSTLGTWYGGVVMGVLLSFNEAAILYRDFNSAPSQKQKIIVFAANNSRCCECHVALTIIL